MISSFMFGLPIVIDYHDTNDKLIYCVCIIIIFNKKSSLCDEEFFFKFTCLT